MYITEREFEEIAMYLDKKLGREATDEEISAYAKEMQDKSYDTLEAAMKGN